MFINLMKKNNNFLRILFVIYVLLIIFMFFYHENWRDEAQAYLLCRDMNFFELFQNVHYEGHPFVYYLLLFPFVKIGIGPKIVNVFSVVFMSVSVYLILFRSKLNTVQKIAIIISYPVLYEFSVVGRSYSLVFLLLTIYALLYSKRSEHPIVLAFVLGMLLNTHILLDGFVAINVLLFYGKEIYLCFKEKKFLEKKNILYGSFIICVFCILLFAQFYPILFPTDGIKMNSNFSVFSAICLFVFMLCGCVGNFQVYSIVISLFLIFLILYHFFKCDIKIFIVFIVTVLFLSSLLSYISDGASIYMFSLVLAILYSCLIMIDTKVSKSKEITFCLIIFSCLSLPIVFNTYYFDIFSNYSNSIDASRFIEKNIDREAVIVCNCDHICSSLIPYVNNKFYHTNSEQYFTYIIWKQKRDIVPDFSKISDFIDDQNEVYYIYTGYNKEDILILDYLGDNYSVKLVYSSVIKSYSGEDYKIYKVEKR